MNDDFDGLLWAYKAVFKQTNAGGGNIVAKFTANERTVLLYGGIGPNDYAANRTVNVSIRDDDDVAIANIMYNAAVDNVVFPFPVSDHSTAASSDGPQFEKRIVLGKGDYIRATALTLVQNEELTVYMRALIRCWPPTVATTGSTGTVTVTTTYDKVI